MAAVYIHKREDWKSWLASIVTSSDPWLDLDKYTPGWIEGEGTARELMYRLSRVASLVDHERSSSSADEIESWREQLRHTLGAIQSVECVPPLPSDDPLWIDARPGCAHFSQAVTMELAIARFDESPDFKARDAELERIVQATDETWASLLGKKETTPSAVEQLLSRWRQLAATSRIEPGTILVGQTDAADVVISLKASRGENFFLAEVKVSGSAPLEKGQRIWRDLTGRDGRKFYAEIGRIIAIV